MIRRLSLLTLFVFICSASFLEARGGRGGPHAHPGYRPVERNVRFGYPGAYGGDYEVVDPYLYPDEENLPQEQ